MGIDKQTLEQAPGFDKDNRTDMADQSWGTRVYCHYGYKPYWETNTGERASDVADKENRKDVERW